MRKYSFLYILAFLLLSAAAYAQPGQKIQVFSDDPDQPVKPTADNGLLVKINPLLIFNGEFPVYVEKQISGIFSVEAGLGVTFRDYAGPLGEYYGPDQVTFFDSVAVRNKYSAVRPGFTFKLGGRIYLDGADDYPEGMYLAAEFRYKTYSFRFTEPNDGLEPGRTIGLTDQYMDFVGVLGRQYELAENLLVDSYTGIGFRRKTVEFVRAGIGQTSLVYTASKGVVGVPLFSVGFKLGYYF